MVESEEVTPEGISPTGNRMLMDTIRNYRAIYDKGCHEYKDQRVKKNAWEAVANIPHYRNESKRKLPLQQQGTIHVDK